MQENNYASILVALDGSGFAEQVLSHVVPIAARFDSRLILLQVIASPTEVVAMATDPAEAASGGVAAREILEAEQQRTAEYLNAVANRLRAQGMQAVDFEYLQGTPAETIARRGRELGVSLIAMTTHGRGGLGRLVFGSVADAVLRDAPCPVLLVRVRETEQAGADN